jgi:adenosine deaminase
MTNIDPNYPLLDLHRHIEGCIRIDTIIDLAREHDTPLPARDEESLRPYIQVIEPQPGVMAFIEKIEMAVSVLVDYEACRRIAVENVEDAQAEGLDYVELRFSPYFMGQPNGLNPLGVVESVIDGVEAGRIATGMRVNLIGIISRTYGPVAAGNELAALLTQRDKFVGIDLAGDEAKFPGELFVDHLSKARDAGWQVTIHAGESSGPESVWQAIRELGAGRIGHAVHALKDAALVDYMAEHGIGIEANLTSNVQTSTVPNYESHPLRRFLELGLCGTINTDDPRISGIDIQHEYEVAAPAAGLIIEQIHQAQRNSLQAAFLSDQEKEALIRFYSQDISS